MVFQYLCVPLVCIDRCHWIISVSCHSFLNPVYCFLELVLKMRFSVRLRVQDTNFQKIKFHFHNLYPIMCSYAGFHEAMKNPIVCPRSKISSRYLGLYSFINQY
jgi:hypothetical protein